MSIKQLNHDDGIRILIKLLYEGKLTPIIGSGFTMGCQSKKANVPDGKKATEIMQSIIKKIRPMDLSKADFNKTSERFFSVVSKEQQWKFFEEYFTDVKVKGYLYDFLTLPWTYVYTLNIDDGIENTKLYKAVVPYAEANVPNSSMRLVYKLHGDAQSEILYKRKKNIVFSATQYIESLTSSENTTIRNAVRSDYTQKNLMFIGCSLVNEPDLKVIYENAKDDMSDNSIRCVIRNKKLTNDEEYDLEAYGINTAIIVKDYELFYREFVREYKKMEAEKTGANYQFMNPHICVINSGNTEENIKWFAGENIFDASKNTFNKSNLYIRRNCVEEIEECLQKSDSVIVRGRRFSGKTAVLSLLVERSPKYSVAFFPSEITVDEDEVRTVFNSSENTLILFDSNSLSEYAYQYVVHSEKIIKKRNNKLVIAVNTNDVFMSDVLNAKTILVSPMFDDKERQTMEPLCDKYGLSRRREKETNLDYLKKLNDDQKIELSLFDLPKKYSRQEMVLLMLLCIKDKLYYSDINALDISYHDVTILIERLQGVIEKVPVSKSEKSSHSCDKLVHNSKYYLLSILKDFDNADVIETVKYVVMKLSTDRARKRLYIETVMFDTLNQLFDHKKGAGCLISDIYDTLEPYLNQDMDYWLQRAKSIYRIYPNDFEKLTKAYQYAKKAISDGNNRTQAKASLTVSLICCFLANCKVSLDKKFDYEIEAITCAEKAIASEYFTKKQNLRGALEANHHDTYYKMLTRVCDKHSNPEYDLQIAWKAEKIKAILGNLNDEV